jgi:hypothetical protein
MMNDWENHPDALAMLKEYEDAKHEADRLQRVDAPVDDEYRAAVDRVAR